MEYIKNGKYKEQLIKYAKDTTFIDFDMELETIKEKFYLPYKSFFDNLYPYYIVDNYFISHSGVNPCYAKEDLESIPLTEFLFNRYDFFNYSNKIHGKIAVFGHTGFNYPYYDGYKIGLDTSAVYSIDNELTAYCIEEEFFINDKNKKNYLKKFQLDRTPWINRKEPYRTEKK